MTTTVSSTTGTASTAASRVTSKMSDIDAQDFLKIMLQELQQQDPFEPVSSKDLIAQVGQIRDIQSSMDLSSTLQDLATSQKLSAAGTFLGKEVTGINADGTKISGIVSSIAREGTNIFLQLESGQRLNVSNVLTVNTPKTTSTTDTTTAKVSTAAVDALTNNDQDSSDKTSNS